MLLEEFILPSTLTQTEVAERLSISDPRLNEIVRGKRGVTPDMPLHLERLLEASAGFLGLQQEWDLWQALHGLNHRRCGTIAPLKRTA